jgi:hypothetical protein
LHRMLRRLGFLKKKCYYMLHKKRGLYEKQKIISGK